MIIEIEMRIVINNLMNKSGCMFVRGYWHESNPTPEYSKGVYGGVGGSAWKETYPLKISNIFFNSLKYTFL